MDPHVIWFFLVGVLLVGYAILDGFDLGVGAMHLFVKEDAERRALLNSIGPVWDGNEVWLVTAGGALFAAFPHAYATAFSGFYIPFIGLLFALIFRAVAMEFRGKEQWPWWRRMWDAAFSVSSIVASTLFGVAVGNMILGIPINASMEYAGGLKDLLRPYAILVGLFNLSIFAMHGSIYLYMKTEGRLQAQARGWIYKTFFVFLALYIITTIITLWRIPSMLGNFERFPWAWAAVVVNVLAIANIPRAARLDQPLRAFLSSATAIAALIFLFGIGVFPNLIVSSLGSEFNMTIYIAASSEKTLWIMFVIALLGMPFVLAYTASIYWIFRGKVRMDRFIY
ncbi:MAG: cytochrome d ubiquinol oxidase subunit II [Candidatus Sumerlaeota bacterium]|nr:cytochrome d ubiquinol oxidase subunit II [Candidatus Sumerlaeota bacterium]